jgi:hypothetical protein
MAPLVTRQYRWIVSAACGALMIAGLLGAHRAVADSTPSPDKTCAKPTPCLMEKNSGAGPAISGAANANSGVDGESAAASSGAGVAGNDFTSGGASGVTGSSTSGTGVTGTSTNGAGVVASGLRGVVGQTSTANGTLGDGNTGALGNGITGILATNTTSTSSDAFLASGSGGNLFRGHDSVNGDVFIVDDTGLMTANGNVTVAGNVTNGGEYHGDTVTSGVVGSEPAVGIQTVNALSDATIEANPIGVFANGYGGLLFRGNGGSGLDVFTVDDSGNVHAHTFTANLAGIRQTTTSGGKVMTFAAQSAEQNVEDYGRAQLVNGRALVAIDPAFASIMDQRAPYMVFVTPEGESNGLFVAQRTPGGFVVQENRGGSSSLTFDYRIVARPFGPHAPRLAPLRTPYPAPATARRAR